MTEEGRVYSSGNNLHGQLGCGEEESKAETSLMLVKGIDYYRKIIQISCGSDHSFALSNIGEVYSWGLNFKGQLGHGDVENWYEATIVASLIPENAWPSSKFNRSKSRDGMMEDAKNFWKIGSYENSPDEKSE